ncbi:DUF885 family protein [Streptomyces sp. NPDC056528]|uniref:DUF885 family protein n=1 Tax=Streptomyces sp. NPDC056528 TaxID=3345854 RepID=UPI0036847EC2
MTALNDLADRYVDDLAELDPCLASAMGVTGQDDRLTDFGPQAVWERAELARRTAKEVETAAVGTESERIAATVLGERLATETALADTAAHATLLETLDGPVQRIRQAVELLDQGPDTPWDALLARLRAIPGTLRGLRESLEAARRGGRVAPYRQVVRNARDCLDTRPYLRGLSTGADAGVPRDARERAMAAANDPLTRFAGT